MPDPTRRPTGVTAPDLANPELFTPRVGVPILDVHERNGRVVDEATLRLVAANSNRRAEAGNPALLLIGHTNDDGPETEQPPVVGFVPRFAMGAWQGRPCILADLYYDRADEAQALKYPHRSCEVFYDDRPAGNYIPAVSLLVREPARDLGLVTYSATSQKERYALAYGADAGEPEGMTAEDAGPLSVYMRDHKIRDYGEGRARYLADKRAGRLAAQQPPLTAEDSPRLARYAARHGITDGAEAVRRYKAAKACGEYTG